MPSTTNSEREVLIESLVRDIGSIDNLSQILSPQRGAWDAVIAGLARALQEVFSVVWKEVIRHLMDAERWRTLARTPDRFEAELDRTIDTIRQIMGVEYNVRPRPTHRPIEQSERDSQIHKLRSEGRTFGQIARHMQITSKVVERAHKRYLQKQADDLHFVLEFAFELIDSLAERGLAPSISSLFPPTEVPPS